MNEKMLPYLAILLSIVAISAAVVVQPDTEIKSGSIDSKKLAQNSVTLNKLADDAVTSENIVDGTITDKDINNTGISKIKDFSINTNHLTQTVLDLLYLNVSGIDNNSITSQKIKDYTIVNDDIANSTISGEKIFDNTITEDDIGSDAIGNDELQDDSVGEDNIQDDGINSDHIQDGAVDTEDIAENAVTQIWQNNTALGIGMDTTTKDGGEDPENPDLDTLLNATINFTTGNNPVLFLFSGVFSVDVAHNSVQIFLLIDDEIKIPATRKGTSTAADKTFTLAFNYIEILEAGNHNVQVRWIVPEGGTGSAYNRVFDIIELKK